MNRSAIRTGVIAIVLFSVPGIAPGHVVAGTSTQRPFLVGALIVLAALAIMLMLWNRLLNRRVLKRTHDLELSEQRFRAIFESAGDAIFLMRDQRFVDCNPRTLELFRCKRHQIIGARPDEFSPPEQPDGSPSAVAATERMVKAVEGEPVRFEWCHRRADGTLFDAEVTLNAFYVGDDLYLQAFVRDITGRDQTGNQSPS